MIYGKKLSPVSRIVNLFRGSRFRGLSEKNKKAPLDLA